MEEILLRYIYDYSFSYKYGDEDFIRSIYEFLFDYYGIVDNINFIFYNDLNRNSIGSYNSTLNQLSFNLENIYDNYKENDKYFDSELDRYMYCNINILSLIFHELEHILQIKEQAYLEYIDKDSDILKLLDYSFLWCDIEVRKKLNCYNVSQSDYNKHHDCFPIERMARLKSYKKVLELLKLDSMFNKKFKSLHSLEYYIYLCDGYGKSNCPSKEYLSKINHSEFWKDFSFFDANDRKILKKVKKKYSLEERLLYGFPIDMYELYEIHSKFLKYKTEIDDENE